MSELQLKSIMQKCGVVGAGGAGFPSYGKLTDGADILLINAVECEPLMYTDYVLTEEKLGEIVEGMKTIMDFANIANGIFAMKDYRAKSLGLEDGQVLGEGIRVKWIPNVYPMGDEINLVYQATGRLIQPGTLPITQGVIVYNAETVYNTRAAVVDGTSVIEKWLTVGGNIPTAYAIKAPVGMRIKDILGALDVSIPDGHVVIDGGPSMGAIKNPATDVITKTTKSLLILPHTAPAVMSKQRSIEEQIRRASSVCCQCTRCTDMCPRNLLGYPIEPHKMIRATISTAQETPELIKTASLCCGCDVCETFACCQDISPMAIIREYKKILAKNKMRYVADPADPVKVNPDREYRMLSAEKWKEVLGVAKFDKHPKYISKPLDASKVEILMSQHIGAPSVPCVSVGDKVEKGQMIATAGNGLSVPQYASISGNVTVVNDAKIVIEV